MDIGETLKLFGAEAQRPDSGLRLDRAALLIAAGEYPDLDVEEQIGRLDGLASRIDVPPDAAPRMRARLLRRFLFEQQGFHGNREDYYDPRNSYLNDVLDRCTGIPITLAVVFIEAGRRIGLEVVGVSYPRHFLVKYRDGDTTYLLDPFNGGHEFDVADFRAEMIERGATPEHLADYYLSGVTRRQLLARMLLNLKAIYLDRRDFHRALRIQEYTIALNPWSFPDIRDRGVLRGYLGDNDGALADLETYVAHAGSESDVPATERLIARLRAGSHIDER
ncbi:MAG: tetratricopeptide repeat protein [Chloroflexi bacterium]|nr:tetratricopeptide repeat protein [Chloroflexota bacterium]